MTECAEALDLRISHYRQSAKFQKRLRNDLGGGDQMLMKDTIAHSVEWSIPINFQGGDN